MKEIQSLGSVDAQKPHELIGVLLQAGWTQEEIAKRIGSTQPTVHRIFSRKRDPRYSVVEKLRQLVLELTDLTEG